MFSCPSSPLCMPAVGQEVNTLLLGQQLGWRGWCIFCLYPNPFTWLFFDGNWPASDCVLLWLSLHRACLVKTEKNPCDGFLFRNGFSLSEKRNYLNNGQILEGYDVD